MKHTNCLFWGLFLSVFSIYSWGQPLETQEEMVVTANRYETPITESGSSVQVISAEELQAMQVSTVAEALRLCSGVQILQSGGPGKTASLFIRGAHTRHTLVLVDGVRINENTSGGANISNLSLSQVERIEIVKGAQSALYGSDAIGGVVQIFTKKRSEEGITTHINLQAGSRDHRRGSVFLSGKKGTLTFGASISRYEIGDYSIAPGGEADPFNSDTIQAQLGIILAEGKGKLDWMARYFDNKTELDGGWGLPEDDNDRNQSDSSLLTSLSWTHRFNDRYQHKLSASYFDQDTRGEDNGSQSYLYTNQQTRFEYLGTVVLNPELTLISGLSRDEQSGENEGNYTDVNISTSAIYSEAIWSFRSNSTLILGARHDDHELFGGESTFKISTNMGLGSQLRVHGSFGTGFKAPGLNDLFWPESPWSSGNPNLTPETSESWDLGLLWQPADFWQFDLTWFDNQVVDLIVWSPDESFIWRPYNLLRASLKGAELNLSSRLTEFLDTRIHYTYLEATDGTTGTSLDYRPENQGGIALTLQLPYQTRLRLDGTHVGKRFETSVAEGFQLESYEKYDISIQSDFGKSFKISLHINNVTDEDYQDYTGYSVPGRYGFLGIDYQF